MIHHPLSQYQSNESTGITQTNLDPRQLHRLKRKLP